MNQKLKLMTNDENQVQMTCYISHVNQCTWAEFIGNECSGANFDKKIGSDLFSDSFFVVNKIDLQPTWMRNTLVHEQNA